MSTFLELKTLTKSGRFAASDLTDIGEWLNARASRIWTSILWQFQLSDLIALALVAGTKTVAVPATLRTVDDVYDDLGDKLERLTRRELFDRFQPSYITGTRDRPTHYAIVNRTIYFAPIPNLPYAFTCDGHLVFGHDDGSGAFVAGKMVADTDKPYWPDNHHYVLVAGAKALGTKLRNDPTYPAMEDEFAQLYAAMVDELAEDHGISSYGVRDPL